jgi:hypothetical protein
LFVLALQQPGRFAGFSTAVAVHDWLPRLEPELRAGAVPEGERSGLATLALAVQRGLLLDLLADSGAHSDGPGSVTST